MSRRLRIRPKVCTCAEPYLTRRETRPSAATNGYAYSYPECLTCGLPYDTRYGSQPKKESLAPSTPSAAAETADG